ncbi:LPS export ABC transporter periplasmic protein LptC [uncultured Acidaminococcus sp.]|uniref:LPS export ABC transporter periplasmic protein LptC n=1 Tax=uncultured Acidaminococcus sp. TaxID=352152 RepID=UPI002805A694|nr:LPS export ABC transporter periplasmic protein LptC [uncultured Acidaminococcus sp.]
MLAEKRRTLLVIAAAVLLMGGVIAWLLSSKPTTGKVQENGKDVLQEVNGSTIQETKNGKKVWELTVQSLLYDKKAQLAHMKGIRGTFYQDDGRTMTVTADEGEVHMDTKDVVLTKNPHGTTSDGGDAVADKFTWINKDQMVVGEGNVRLKKDDTVATAKKATFNVALDQAKLEEDAHVQKGEF